MDVIYQATFIEGGFSGQSDFVRKVSKPSKLGPWSYEPEDTKLALSPKASALLQLLAYARMIEAVQGVAPEEVHVLLGRAEETRASFRTADYAAYHRLASKRLSEFVAKHVPTKEATLSFVADPVEHCGICPWWKHCGDLRKESGHLSAVAFIRKTDIERLRDGGVGTIDALGALGPTPPRIDGLKQEVLERLQDQAAMQVETAKTGRTFEKILEHSLDEEPRGLLLLPEPSKLDVFFDFEGDRFALDEGLEYLFGWVEQPDAGVEPKDARYRELWAHDRAEERVALETFIDEMTERRKADARMHIYHYAPYEPVTLQRLTSRHETRQEELDVLLRAGVFVDLYKVVLQGVRVSSPSYSIKRLEPMYEFRRDKDGIALALSSMIAYERYLTSRNADELVSIAEYNRDDCVSTLQLRSWLEERRATLVATLGRDPARPEGPPGDPSEEKQTEDAEVSEVRAALTGGISEDAPDAELTPEDRGRRLLGRLLGWHRRESRAEFFEWIRMVSKEPEELAGETGPLVVDAGFENLGMVKKSVELRWRFEPGQETNLRKGMAVTALWPIGPDEKRERKTFGTITELDPRVGVVQVTANPDKLGIASEVYGFIEGGPPGTKEQRASLLALGRQVAADGIDGPGPARAVRDILLGRRPRLTGGRVLDATTVDGLAPAESMIQLAAELDESYLAVQGPPGSGKSTNGAKLVIELIRAARRDGRRQVIGVTAFSHAVIENLLNAIAKEAKSSGFPIEIAQRTDFESSTRHEAITVVRASGSVAPLIASGQADVIGGTTWVWSRPDLEQSLDTLIVDEAGQISLANVAAIGRSTRNLILLGDPQQLSQPIKAAHPDGAEASVLEHVIGHHQAMPPERGILLDTTWRLHPRICTYTSELFYEGKLKPGPATRHFAIDGPSPLLSGSGLRLLPVLHERRSTSSPEEADVVAGLVRELLGRPWTDSDGAVGALTPEQILVVSPYNSQVARLRQVLPDDVRAGTVDKFQGQEAPVVIYSMATSGPADMPRDMSFLFSLNRFNVATSRAQALVIVVCNPALLAAPCRTPEQMRLVNALARYVEMADGAGAA